jgi:thioredoxin-like negative regulator of GroEL
MSQAQNIPPQFKELIEAARNSAEACVEVAKRLIENGLTRSVDYAHLKCQQDRAAEVERQIQALQQLVESSAKVAA